MGIIKRVGIGHTLIGNGLEKVIVLHGWMDDSEIWSPIIGYLNLENFTYAFMDVRGYGKSKNITGRYNSDEIANDIFNLADELNWDNFSLIGYSMTGMAVQKASLLDKNSRIKKIVAVTPVSSAGFAVHKDILNLFKSSIQNHEETEKIINIFSERELPNNWKGNKASRLIKMTSPKAQRGYLYMWTRENFSKRVTKIKNPFLVISGKYDHPGFTIEAQKRAFEKYENVKYIDIESSSHFPMQETPLLLASYIENFLYYNN